LLAPRRQRVEVAGFTEASFAWEELPFGQVVGVVELTDCTEDPAGGFCWHLATRGPASRSISSASWGSSRSPTS
jgi:hypothetical protein